MHKCIANVQDQTVSTLEKAMSAKDDPNVCQLMRFTHMIELNYLTIDLYKKVAAVSEALRCALSGHRDY
jgi:hypothetical protein